VHTIEKTLQRQAIASQTKRTLLRTPARFATAGVLGGAFVGVGVVLMLSTAGPLRAEDSPWAPLVSGGVFGIALTLVVFAGAELATSAMMTNAQGLAMRAVGPWSALGGLGFTLVANLVGSLGFAGVIVAAGVLQSHPDAAQMLADLLTGKAAESPVELFARGALCNALVCLGVWMCARLTSEIAKLTVIFWTILAFVASGFEHVVANMTTYSLGLLLGDPNATPALFGANLLWVGLGNLVGGGLVVGVGYWVIGGSPRNQR
jgi:nitrite transporter NirC